MGDFKWAIILFVWIHSALVGADQDDQMAVESVDRIGKGLIKFPWPPSTDNVMDELSIIRNRVVHPRGSFESRKLPRKRPQRYHQKRRKSDNFLEVLLDGLLGQKPVRSSRRSEKNHRKGSRRRRPKRPSLRIDNVQKVPETLTPNQNNDPIIESKEIEVETRKKPLKPDEKKPQKKPRKKKLQPKKKTGFLRKPDRFSQATAVSKKPDFKPKGFQRNFGLSATKFPSVPSFTEARDFDAENEPKSRSQKPKSLALKQTTEPTDQGKSSHSKS